MRTHHYELFENEDGVHLLIGDYALCGDGFEGQPAYYDELYEAPGEMELGEMRPTNERTVTCPRCVSIIVQCRGIRVDKSVLEENDHGPA